MASTNYRNLIENLYEGLLYVDKDERIKYWSKGAEKITGYSSSEVFDKQYSQDFLCPIDVNGKKYFGNSSLFFNTIANGTLKQFELLVTHKDGHKIAISTRIAPMYDSKDRVVGATQLFTDNKDHLEHLIDDSEEYQQSFFDPITKLPNHVSIEMSIDAKLSEFRRYNRPFGVLLIEIDDYEKLNNIYGDELKINILTEISKMINKDLRPFDIAGRWSDSEFAIILVNVREDSVEMIGNRVRDIVEKAEFTIGKGMIDLTISVAGIIATPHDTNKILIEKLRESTEKCYGMGGNKFLLWSAVE